MKKQTTILIGANSAIAKSLAQEIITEHNTQLIVISRNTQFYQQDLFENTKVIQVNNYHESQIISALDTIKREEAPEIGQVFICHGLLHNENCQPEKRLEDFSERQFIEILSANTITPMLWLKHLTPLLSESSHCKVVIFTARVGSISDNKLGGWYSYRASKAAMNMLIKSTAIELARRAKNIKLISFHPGTTDTPLSQPFQKNVPKGKLFSSDFVSKQLLKIIESLDIDGEASFIDWQGKPITW